MDGWKWSYERMQMTWNALPPPNTNNNDRDAAFCSNSYKNRREIEKVFFMFIFLLCFLFTHEYHLRHKCTCINNGTLLCGQWLRNATEIEKPRSWTMLPRIYNQYFTQTIAMMSQTAKWTQMDEQRTENETIETEEWNDGCVSRSHTHITKYADCNYPITMDFHFQLWKFERPEK